VSRGALFFQFWYSRWISSAVFRRFVRILSIFSGVVSASVCPTACSLDFILPVFKPRTPANRMFSFVGEVFSLSSLCFGRKMGSSRYQKSEGLVPCEFRWLSVQAWCFVVFWPAGLGGVSLMEGAMFFKSMLRDAMFIWRLLACLFSMIYK
jgi:hypothetical protein